ncbi:MAG: hypothetical protein HY748_11845 [Elusimicrobia bacterium]|nr:hypothetical protein [Elusimicrobiota bacterium]
MLFRDIRAQVRSICVGAAAAFVLALAPAVSFGEPPFPFKDGEKPLTPRQQAYLKGKVLKIDKVLPNKQSTMRAAALGVKEGLAPSVKNWQYLPDVGNQGSQNSCTGWTTCYYQKTYQEAKERGWNRPNPLNYPDRIMSPAFCYNLMNEGTDDGSNRLWIAQMVAERGSATLQYMPYDVNDYWTWPSESAFRAALPYRAQSAAEYIVGAANPSGIDSLKQDLANGDLVTIGIHVHQTFYSNYPNNAAGINNGVLYDDNGAYLGAHAVTLIGYDDNKAYNDGSPKTGAFYAVNSWGGNWGVYDSDMASSGFLWIAYAYVRDNIPDDHTAVTMVDRAGYTPTKFGVFGVTHQKRGDLWVQFIGGDNPVSPNEDWLVDVLYYAGGDFPVDQNIVADLTDEDVNPYRDNWLGVADDNPTVDVGVITSMSIEIPSTGVRASADVPKNTVNGGDIYVELNALPVAAPSGLTAAVSGTSQITWSWNAVSDALSYNVYVASNTATLLGNTAATSFSRTDLTANTYTGVVVRGLNGHGEGTPAIGPSTATYAPASAVTAAVPFVSSVTADFNTVASNSGYRVDASTASDFTGTIFSSGSANPASSRLTVPGLSPLTSYYLRVAVLNQLGAQVLTTYGSQVYTLTSITAPGPGAFRDFGYRQVRMSWTAGSNPGGLNYTAQASTASDFTGTVSSAAGADMFSNLFAGLQVNTSYYFRVWATGGPAWSTGPVATYALSPATATPLFQGVAAQGFTVNWTPNGNPADTLYESQVSRAADFFTMPVVSSFTRNSYAAFGTLTPNSLYYARVRAISHGGQPMPLEYRSLSSTGTLAQTIAPVDPYFQSVRVSSLTALFDSGTNPAGTGYIARLSTAADFSAVHAQVTGVMVSGVNAVLFTGLESNRRLYLQTAALNVTQTPTAFTPAAQSTATLAAIPAASATPFTVYFTSITFRWSSGGNRAGTQYDVLVDDDPDFASPNAGQTTSLSSTTVDLSSNTVYYLRARARSLEPDNPDSVYADLPSRFTLPEPPSADPAGAFVSVTLTSATVRWLARPPAPPTATCSGYRIELARTADFSGTVYAAEVAGAAATVGALKGLQHSTTYYLRVGAMNADGNAAYTSMGSTRTLVPRISSGAILGSTELVVVPTYPEVTMLRVSIPEKAFAVGTPVELDASVEDGLPSLGAQTDLSFLGPGAGFWLDAGGLQPQRPVPITLGYDLPAGVDADLLMLARYDEMSRHWVPLPSSVDKGAKTLTGLTDHFSFFAPVIVQPGSGLSGVEIYPIPWEPESGNILHGGAVLTVAKLPALAKVRVYTIMGELVDEGTAGASGVLHWDGRNTRGRRAGTGTYLVMLEWGGGKDVRRIVLIR